MFSVGEEPRLVNFRSIPMVSWTFHQNTGTHTYLCLRRLEVLLLIRPLQLQIHAWDSNGVRGSGYVRMRRLWCLELAVVCLFV